MLKVPNLPSAVPELVSAGPDLTFWPNPFRQDLHVEWSQSLARFARLAVHDASGRRIRVLADGRLGPGVTRLTWDGRDDRGRRVGSGIYWLTGETSDPRSISRKIVVLR